MFPGSTPRTRLFTGSESFFPPIPERAVSNSTGTAGTPPKIWKQHDLKWYFNAGVLIDGHLYSISGTTHRPTELVCAEASTGETVWSEENYRTGGLIAARDRVILLDQGLLTIFPARPDGFEPILRQQVLEGKCWTAPVLANGRIFCRNAPGKVVALGVSEAAP